MGTPASRLEVVARSDEGDGALSGTELTLLREAVVYRALAGVEVRTPRLLTVDEDQRRMLLTRAPGTAEWTDDLLDQLARLHRLDATGLDLGWSALEDWSCGPGSGSRRACTRS